MFLVDNMSFSYDSRPILDNVSVGVGEGECVAVLGNNGAGKSTLIKCVCRILRSSGGAVSLGGEDMARLSRAELAKRVAYVAQDGEAGETTVFDAVLLGRKPHMRFFPSRRDYRITEEVITQLGLRDLALRRTDELSGGELQKVMLARALAQEPKVLLLDEPTSKLDLKRQHEILALIRDVARRRGLCVMIVIHDLNLALRYCDRFLLLKDGGVIAQGGVEVMTPSAIGQLYDMPVSIESVAGCSVVVPVPA